MIEFTWKIESLEKNVADGGVVRANWRVNAVDGDYRTSGYGGISFTPDPDADGFIPFESLTEDVVLSWIFLSIDSPLDSPVITPVPDATSVGLVDRDALEARLTADIEEQKTPATTISGIGPEAENPFPWDTE
jgi:hypothetical protein